MLYIRIDFISNFLNRHVFGKILFLDASGSGNGEERRVRTLYACVGEHESELSFEPNQLITDGKSLDILT